MSTFTPLLDSKRTAVEQTVKRKTQKRLRYNIFYEGRRGNQDKEN